MRVSDALKQGVEVLAGAGIPDPAFTAELLLRHALHCERAWLFAHSGDELEDRVRIHYGRFLSERLKRKPTQYITGIQEFYGREFRVNQHVLIPRPETEHVVETALKYLTGPAVDVGTGSGAIAVTLALESGATVFACDISPDAISMASRNAATHKAQVRCVIGDLLTFVRPSSLELIVSNPPYIAEADKPGMQPEVRDWEPHGALFAGESGLDVYRALLAQGAMVLRPGAHMVLELGYDSLPGVRRLLGSAWEEVEVVQDLAGWARVFVARLL